LPAGIALSFGHTIEGHLFGINAWDPLKFAAGGLGLGVAALAGCWVPARRAAAVDPIEVMRQEM
jgi:ABC-type antimicrobial peptide transport system permease subunit